MSITLTKPYAVYSFARSQTAKGTYILAENYGTYIQNLCGVGKRAPNKGVKHIKYDETLQQKINGRQFRKSLWTTNADAVAIKKAAWEATPVEQRTSKTAPTKARITGLNFDSRYPHRAYGDTCHSAMGGIRDAVLIEFSADMGTLTLWFFSGMAEAQHSLFEAWVNGELLLSVDMLILPDAPQSGEKKVPDLLCR
jgi:hypothetical protein